MNIKTALGYFDLEEDFSIEIEETSPIMNDRGSQSIPVTIPLTPNNKKIIEFGHRIDSDSRLFSNDKNCVITDGIYSKAGKINVTDINPAEGISLNIGIDNSDIYSAWKNRRLKQLKNLPINIFSSKDEFSIYLESILNGEIDADFSLFPVVLSNDGKTCTEKKTEGKEEVTESFFTYYPFITNAIKQEWDNKTGKYRSSLVWKARNETFLIDDEAKFIYVSDFFGVSPFIYIWRVLELIFDDLGYSIENNIFKTDFELNRIVMLHNCVDCCCLSSINYEDMLPECSIEDFLNSLYVKFGFLYAVDSSAKTVKFSLIKDLIRQEPEFDISNKICGDIIRTLNTHKCIVLSNETSLPGSQPTEERFEDYIMKCKGLILSVNKLSLDLPKYNFYYEDTTGRIFTLEEIDKIRNREESSFCPCNFNWDKNESDMDEESLSSKDESVYMGYSSMSEEQLITPYYLTGLLLRYSANEYYEKYLYKNNIKTPLAFTFAFNKYQNMRYPFGSTLPNHPDGGVIYTSKIHTLNLRFALPDGLFDKFWKDYDSILRYANETIEVQLLLNKSDLLALHPFKIIRFKGQPMLLDKFSYNLPAENKVLVTMKLMSLKMLKPFDTLKLNKRVLGIDSIGYYWELSIKDKANFIEQVEDEAREYVKSAYPYWNITKIYISNEIWILAPKPSIDLKSNPPISLSEESIEGPGIVRMYVSITCLDEDRREQGVSYNKDYNITGIYNPKRYNSSIIQ